MNCIVFRVNGTDSVTTPYANTAAALAAATAYEGALDGAHGEDWTMVLENFVQPGGKFCVLIDGDGDVALVAPPATCTREECGDEWYAPPGALPGNPPGQKAPGKQPTLGRRADHERKKAGRK